MAKKATKPTAPNPIDAPWNERARAVLSGRTITSVRYMEPDEADSFGWDERGLVLVLDNGTTLIVQRDDEGNGPGALWYDQKGEQHILPVLSRF